MQNLPLSFKKFKGLQSYKSQLKYHIEIGILKICTLAIFINLKGLFLYHE